MKIKHILILFSMFILLANCSKDDQLLILYDVTIIDGTGSFPQPSSCIVIEGGKITRICKKGEYDYPKSAKVLLLSSKYVIPGLIEMHAHTPIKKYQEEVCKTMLAFGITTMRNPGASSHETGIELRDKLESGEIIGPRMFTAGWLIAGPEPMLGGIEVKTEEEIRKIVKQQALAGVDYIKLYTHLTPDLVKAAIDEAHSLGLEVIGHLGKTSWTYAANAGIDGLCHSAHAGPIWELIPVKYRDEFYNLSGPTKKFNPNLYKRWGELFDINGPELKELTKALVDNNVVVDPTLVMMEALIWGDDTIHREILEPGFAPKEFYKYWRDKKFNPSSSWWSLEVHLEAQKLFPVFQSIVKHFYDNGVLITTGTDQGNPWITPGVSLHRELKLLVETGISPIEVIKIATHNGAKALHILEETGTVEVGKQADLVVLSSNPEDNIENTREIEMIIKYGKIYYPSELLSK